MYLLFLPKIVCFVLIYGYCHGTSTVSEDLTFADALTGFAFQRVFLQPKNKTVLRGFLNDLLKDWGPVESVKLQPELQPDKNHDQNMFSDAHCRKPNGTEFIVQIQMRSTGYFLNKIVDNANPHLLRRKGKEKESGEGSKELKTKDNTKVRVDDTKTVCNSSSVPEVILLVIVGPVMDVFEADPRPLTYHEICDVETKRRSLRGIRYIFFELSKCLNLTTKSLKTNADRWAYFFLRAPEVRKEDLPAVTNNDASLLEAYSLLDMRKFTPQETKDYSASVSNLRDQISYVGQAKEQGKEKASPSTKAKEIEAKVSLGIAERCLNDGMDINTVALISNLPVSVVEKLQEKMLSGQTGANPPIN